MLNSEFAPGGSERDKFSRYTVFDSTKNRIQADRSTTMVSRNSGTMTQVIANWHLACFLQSVP